MRNRTPTLVRPRIACLLAAAALLAVPALSTAAAPADGPAVLPTSALATIAAAGAGQDQAVTPIVDPQRAQAGEDTPATDPATGSSFDALLASAAAAAGPADQVERPTMELSLQDAVELALRNNLSVRISRFGQEQSFAQIMGSRSQFDPRLSFNVPQSFGRSTNPTTDQTQGADILSSQSISGGFSFSENLEWGTSWSVGFSSSRRSNNSEFSTFNPSISSGLNMQVSQPLLNGFGSVNRIGIIVAQNNYDSSQEQFRQSVQGTLQQVYNAYWSLVGQLRGLEVQLESEDLARQQLDRVQKQVEIGTQAPIETVQPDRQLATAVANRIAQENAVENAQDTLKELMNLQSVRDDWAQILLVPTDEPDQTVETIDLEQALATAMDNDPVLAQNRIALDNARLNVQSASNNLLPQVNVNASLNFSGIGGNQIIRGGLGGGEVDVVTGGLTDSLSQVFSGDFNTWSIGAQVIVPLHNWQARSQHAQARIGEQRSATTLAQRQQQVMFDVRTAVRNVQSLQEQVTAATRARELAQRQLEAEERRFQVGSSTNFQVLQFQQQLTQAQVSELNAIINFASARAQLEVAKGTFLQYLGVEIQDAGQR